MVLQIRGYTIEEFDEFVKRPENVERSFEYIAGEVVEVVSNPLASKIAAIIIGALIAYLKDHDIGHVTGADGGYMVVGERYIPDAAFISYERQPELEYYEGYNPNPPHLAVEVLSPSNDDSKMRVKVANYQAAGTMVWVVNPVEKVVEVYVPGQPVKFFRMEGVLDGGDLLPDFRLPVKDLFPPKRGE